MTISHALGLLLLFTPFLYLIHLLYRKGHLDAMLKGTGIGLLVIAWVYGCVYLLGSK